MTDSTGHRRFLVAASVALLLGIPSARGGCPPHWIVSTHDCEQRTNGWCAASCPRVFVHGGGDAKLSEVPRESLATSLRPGAPVIVFVHGSFLNWGDTLERARNTFAWFEEHRGDDLHPHYVALTWPSDPITRVLPGIDVNILGRRAQLNGYYLARFVNELPPGTPITFVGHSHGSRVAAGALHVLGGGCVWGHGIPREELQPRRIRTVFAAAAMDHHWMNIGERYQNAWLVTDGLVHLKNPRDVALDIYPLRKPFSKRALGQVGFEARELVRLGRYADGLVEIDVSTLIGRGHKWHHYRRDEIGHYLAPYVFHEVPVVTRESTPPMMMR